MAGHTRKQLDAHRSSGRATREELEQEWVNEGGDPRWAAPMARISLRESGGKLRINNRGLNKNGTVDWGAYQVNDIWRSDPVVGPLFKSGAILTLKGATQAAIHIFKTQGPKAWATYNPATDRQYLGAFSGAKSSTPSAPAATQRGKVSATSGTPPRLLPGGDKLDTQGAVTAALLDPRKKMSLGSRIIENVQSGKYTTSTPASVKPGKAGTYSVSPAKATVPRVAASAPNAKPTRSLTGTANFEGKTVAAWIKPALVYARAHGWKGVVNSGFRTDAEQTRIYNSGVRPAAVPRSLGGGGSNHEGADFPAGAVDVSDAQTLSRILARSPYAKKLQWAGAKDPVHFSHPHNGSY